MTFRTYRQLGSVAARQVLSVLRTPARFRVARATRDVHWFDDVLPDELAG